MRGQLDVQHRQGDRDATARREHPVQIAVVRIVVVVDVAGKPELLEEEAVQPAQPLHRHRK